MSCLHLVSMEDKCLASTSPTRIRQLSVHVLFIASVSCYSLNLVTYDKSSLDPKPPMLLLIVLFSCEVVVCGRCFFMGSGKSQKSYIPISFQSNNSCRAPRTSLPGMLDRYSYWCTKSLQKIMQSYSWLHR